MGVRTLSEAEPALPRSAPDAHADVLDSTAAGGRIVRGGVLRFVGYVLMVALSVLSAALLTRHLGLGRFGRYTTVLSLVAIVAAVTDAGMSAVGTREFAVRGGAERDSLMSDLLGLRIALTAFGVVLVSGFALAAGYAPALFLGAVLASLGTIALVVQHTHTIPIGAELRLGTLSALELARQALSVCAIVALVLVGAGLLPLLAVVPAVNLALIAPTAALARGRISLRVGLHPRRWLGLLRLTVAYSLASAVGTLYIYAAQIITSLVASERQSGLFAASFRIFIVAGGVSGLLASGALPLLARAARDDRKRLGYALSRIFEVSLILGVAAALATLAGAQFIVGVVAGPKFAAAAPVLQIQGLALIATFVLGGWSLALISLERYAALVRANLAALLVSASLTVLLARSHGAQGAALATVCGESVLALATLSALVRAAPKLRPRLGVLAKVALASLPAAALALGPALPSLARMLLALGAYGLVILLTRAVPREVLELLPARLQRVV
jgi:O-antigen/teichoic acid export membrane protein